VRPTLGISGRLALAIVLTAAIPLGAAIVFARSMVQQASERFFVPELRQNLERSLEMYADLARATKANMRHEAALLAQDRQLSTAVASGDRARVHRRLEALMGEHIGVVSLAVEDASGETLAEVARGRPVDPTKEHQLVVPRALLVAGGSADIDGGLATPRLVVVLATDKSRFDEREEMAEFVSAYSKLEARRAADEQTYVLAFAALLGMTILSAIGVGTLLARSVTRRVSELALATRRVGAGDLSIRVQEDSLDEIGDLGRAFNHMLHEVEGSRDRIEYLSRLASWQEMAKRLAHEIKNPLTPIQLAVQEVHQRLAGLSAEQRKLLDDALEIVESEVQTLRRLVGEFSEFARLPESRMEAADLFEFLRDLKKEAALPGNLGLDGAEAGNGPNPSVVFEVPPGCARVYLDRQLMRRVFINLLRNAAQAGAASGKAVRIWVRVEERQQFYELLIDDDGPGVAQALRSQIFEPYVTTKDDGTGLGLAIVKKIVIEHKGHIEMLQSPAGGARVRLLLPKGGRASTPPPGLALGAG
jgi:nitrogen fixation/metabolism regulation signal transduction histidine kinase